MEMQSSDSLWTKQNLMIVGVGIVAGYILNPASKWLYRKVAGLFKAKIGQIVMKDGKYYQVQATADGGRALVAVDVTIPAGATISKAA